MNSTNIEKIGGYILLIVGLALIILPLYQTYAIFVGHAEPPQIFGKAIEIRSEKVTSSFDIQQQVENALVKMLPIDLIDKSLNLLSWLVLIWIFIFGGRQLSEIGIKLLKSPPQ